MPVPAGLAVATSPARVSCTPHPCHHPLLLASLSTFFATASTVSQLIPATCSAKYARARALFCRSLRPPFPKLFLRPLSSARPSAHRGSSVLLRPEFYSSIDSANTTARRTAAASKPGVAGTGSEVCTVLLHLPASHSALPCSSEDKSSDACQRPSGVCWKGQSEFLRRPALPVSACRTPSRSKLATGLQAHERGCMRADRVVFIVGMCV